MFSIFTSCKLGNVNDMREWDLSFGGIQKLVSTPCLNKELILGRPFLIQYIDSSSLNPQLHSRSATYIKRNGLLIRKITIKSSRPFQCAYHPLTP